MFNKHLLFVWVFLRGGGCSLSPPRLNIFTVGNMGGIICLGQRRSALSECFVFACFAHGKFQNASFNRNREIRQNVGLDGGDGDGPQNNTSLHFSKMGGR